MYVYMVVCICICMVVCMVVCMYGWLIDWVSDWVSKWVIYDNVFICYCNDGSSEWVVLICIELVSEWVWLVSE